MKLFVILYFTTFNFQKFGKSISVGGCVYFIA